jgi:hypothetical protein
MTMTDREKKIAEIRSKSYPGRVVSVHAGTVHDLLSDIRFLLSELDRIKNIADDLSNDVFGLNMMLEEEHEENRKLREVRDKLIEGLRWYDGHYDGGKRARSILKEIGVNINE